MSRRNIAAVAAAGVVAAAALAVPALAALDETLMVSRANGAGGAGGVDGSFNPSVTGDGRYVAFHSSSTNFPLGDEDFQYVYVRDVQLGTTVLVSRASGTSPMGEPARGYAINAAIARNGRYVVFVSDAGNLGGGVPSGCQFSCWNYYLRDLQANTTTWIAAAGDDDRPPGLAGSLFKAAISSSGRYVAFVAQDQNGTKLAGDAANADIYLWDRDLPANDPNKRRLISRDDGATGAGGNDESTSPAISGDGTRVAFASMATNLSFADVDQFEDVFYRDWAKPTPETVLVSATNSQAANGFSKAPAISADGRVVAFSSNAPNLVGGVSGNPDVFVKNLQTGAIVDASRTGADGPTGQPSDGASFEPDVSDDGRFVVFSSLATNLSQEDGAANEDVYLRDMQAQRTYLVSRPVGSPPNAPANASSLLPAIAGGVQQTAQGAALYVAFQSLATNLAEDDTNQTADVFRRDAFGPPPTNTAAPAIAGDAGVGSTISCQPGSWTGQPDLTGRWQRNGADIPGATSPSYTVQAADAGQQLACVVTAANLAGSATAASAPVAVPVPPPPPPPPADVPLPPPLPPQTPPSQAQAPAPRRSTPATPPRAATESPAGANARVSGVTVDLLGRTLTVSYRLQGRAKARVQLMRKGFTSGLPRRQVFRKVAATPAVSRVTGAYQVVLRLRTRPAAGDYQVQVVVTDAGGTSVAKRNLKVRAATRPAGR